MKKSEIEAIPYCKHGNKEWYAGTKIAHLSDQNARIIDIFYQGQPVVRYVIGASQYLTYICTEKKWSQAKIKDEWSYNGKFYSYVGQSSHGAKITVSKSIKEVYRDRWIDEIMKRQVKINSERKERNDQLRDFEARKTAGTIPNISDRFKSFVEKDWGQGIMWTLHQNGRTFLTCSKCGNRDVVPGTIKKSKKIKCAYCGESGIRTPEKEYEHIIEESRYYNDVRPYEKGIAIIAVNVTRIQQAGQPIQFEYEEQAAEIFLPGRKTTDEYWIYGDRWKKGVQRERQWGCYDTRKAFPTGATPPYAIRILNASKLKYTGWEHYGYEMYKYLREWQKYPGIEMLAKQGLRKLITFNLNAMNYPVKIDYMAHNLADALGILPERKKLLKESEGDPELIRAMRLEKELGRMQDETLQQLKTIGSYNYDVLREVAQWVSPDKALKYIKTQETDIRTYGDFLRMRVEMGYDMTDRLFPRDLIAAHDDLVNERDREKINELAAEYERKFPDVKKSYRRLNRIFKFKTNDYIIRPARSCTEIVNEGTTLHHCVGASETYVSRHAQGKSYILFLRKADKPNKPFATIEIGSDFKIRQWYEAYDKKPDEDKIQPVLNQYEEHLKEAL